MEILIIVILLASLLGIWVTITRQKLVEMNENVNLAMAQLGIQLSSCFEAVKELLDLVMRYATSEARMLLETIESRHSMITADSTPEDVLGQEGAITEVICYVVLMAEQCPELKIDKNYEKCMIAVGAYKKMGYTSKLIYNDSVAKLNQTIQKFPTYLIAGLLGFHPRNVIS